MADTSSHLERMGRELKCPICLSLLDSSVSLTCNHVFCRSCIHKSMKSGSNCPVCKVPYQRREIRPAPHMDSLVNIYKSMEVSSGVSLYVSQNPSTAKSSDAEKKTESDGDTKAQENGGETPETVKNQRTKGISPKTRSRSNTKRKPSFSTNKRVQVPQSPFSETPVRQAINELGKNKRSNNVTDKNTAVPSEHPPSSANGNPLFSPFFWLREEEDADKSSQRTDVDVLTGTPVKAPSFSDIKDSDDEEEAVRRCNKADLFDSEMFEWTQRACSPELCSSPIKMQVDTGGFGGMQEEELEGPSKVACNDREEITKHLDFVSPLGKNRTREEELCNDSFPGSERNNDVSTMTQKRGRKASERTHIKRRKRNVGQVAEDQDSPEIPNASMQSQGCDYQFTDGTSKSDHSPKAKVVSISLRSQNEAENPAAFEVPASLDSIRGTLGYRKSKRSTRNLKSINQRCEYNDSFPGSESKDDVSTVTQKRGKKASKTTHIKRQKKNVGQVAEGHDGPDIPDASMQSLGCDYQFTNGTSKSDLVPKAKVVSADVRSQNEAENPAAFEVPASLGSIRGTPGDWKSKRSTRNLKSANQRSKVGEVKRNKQKQDLVHSDIITEVEVSPDARNEETMSKSHVLTEKSAEKVCSAAQGSTGCTTRRKNRRHGQMRRGIEEKVSNDKVSAVKVADGSKDVQLHAAVQAELTNVQLIFGNDDLGGSVSTGKAHLQRGMPALRKCDAKSIKCAFCHSSEETEDSGKMVHYSEGRPVLENHSTGSVIHSHKNCTEWAPDVYFEDEIAVNLEEELARSRRIKCSLCGIKGAALGCYEKSCRRSFHVPCAKKLRGCRWDTDHFVILCPLHASLKLPCELPASQVKKGKSILKRKYVRQQSKVASGNDNKTNLWTCHRSSEKLVLCCSGLSTAEKEIVSGFAKSSGVVVSKSWNPSVTHVIASVDENESCRRTLKVLMGILEGKWILSFKWVEACLNEMRLVEEIPFEISHDIHGVHDGPRLGRLRLLNKLPKLFAGFKFYLCGDFVPLYKGYLQDLVTAAGGTVLHRKPIAETPCVAESGSSVRPTIIIYSIELPDKCDPSKKTMILQERQSDAETLASSSGSTVATNAWLLNCIAGHRLLRF